MQTGMGYTDLKWSEVFSSITEQRNNKLDLCNTTSDTGKCSKLLKVGFVQTQGTLKQDNWTISSKLSCIDKAYDLLLQLLKANCVQTHTLQPVGTHLGLWLMLMELCVES